MRTRLQIAFISILVACLSWQNGHTQGFSNMGKDFWIGYGNHVRMSNPGAPEKMQLYITSDVATSGMVSIPGINHSQSFSVSPNQITTIDIPRGAALMNDGQFNLGIRVTAEKPVVVYSFIFVNAISGATVCLPTNTLGKEYFSVNYKQESNEINSPSYFFVIAADTGKTTVEITPSADTRGGKKAGVPFVVTLNQGEVYQVLGATDNRFGEDLTGSRIRSINTGAGCKKIAVYCGSAKISIGCASPLTSDNLYQQMYPTSTWGKKYITVPTLRNSVNYFRIMKSEPEAVVRVNGSVIPAAAFTNNFYHTFSSGEPNVIESDKPILVAQYMTSQNCGGNSDQGDPDMIFLNPVEQTIDKVTLNSMQPAEVNINVHYLNVVLKNKPGAINSFRMDGQPVVGFLPVPFDNEYAYARIQTIAGTHSLSCDSGFNVIAYGFGNAESYGYSGGTNLKDLYQYLSVANAFATPDFPATCQGNQFQPAIVFPFQALKIKWRFNGLYPDETVETPQADSSWVVNGRRLYRYQFPRKLIAPVQGSYPIKIVATNGTIDGCTGEQEAEFELTVAAPLKAKFEWNTRGCLGDSVYLKEQYSGSGMRPAMKWLWNLGNGDSSMRANPQFRYEAVGNYPVSFAVANDWGCISDTATTNVPVNPLPVSNFSVKAPFCEGKDIRFTDASTVSPGSIVSWKWNMGNDTVLTRNNAQPFTHQYAGTGNYTVKLEITSDKGCTDSSFRQSFSVHPVPVAGFVLPGNCLNDPFSQFQDTSKIADGSQAQLRYAWNFGNPSAGTGNNSTAKDPKHKYTATGLYPVSLVVTSNNGCIDSVKQELSINGSQPVSAFEIKDGSTQCSNKEITLINKASVDVGKIIKVEIYWDANGDRTKVLVDEDPQPGEQYTYNYPEFNTPATRSYAIEVVAYSGESCLISSRQTSTLRQTPLLQFDAPPSVCSNIPSVQITGALVRNGLTGQGTFSGRGVSPQGLFVPATAGVGQHLLRYTFTDQNNCSNFLEQPITVLKTPLINAGADRVSVRGRPVVLQASTPDRNLQFRWSPATGMNDASLLQPTVVIQQDQLYRITATSADGCIATDEVWVQAPTQIFVPNSFTPNGDGVNDKWRIPYLDPEEKASVRVYNRDGYLVYQCTGCWVEWDGMLKGKPQPSGTYVYVIDFAGKMPLLKGTLTLIR